MDPTTEEGPPGPRGRIRIGPGVGIAAEDLTWRFSTPGGPGGQHANRASTRAEVQLDVASAAGLPEWARDRLLSRLGPVVSATAGDERSQARNRALALQRLVARLEAALHVAPVRRPTRPSRASQRRRLEAKRRQGERKRDRTQRRGDDWD